MPFELVRNDITKMRVDAIVNAANGTLLGGGGVDGAIHRAAGPELLAECRTLGGCRTGEAKITRGYNLPAKYVIHTVGPVWQGGHHGEAELLAACYRHSLALAAAYGCETVAFPLISAGTYGYPKAEAMGIARDEIVRFLDTHDDMTVILVLFGRTSFLTGKELFRDVREYIDDVYADAHVQQNVESQRRQLWQLDRIRALRYEEELRAKQMAPQEAAAESVPADFCATVVEPAPNSGAAPDLKEMLKRTDEGFSQTLLRLIDERGMTDAQCYKRANVDRKLFSKIRSNPAYKPSKATVFAFAVALRLSLPEAEDLLRRAGFAFTHSSKFDIVVEYFLLIRRYDILEINEVLFDLDLPLLGSGMN